MQLRKESLKKIQPCFIPHLIISSFNTRTKVHECIFSSLDFIRLYLESKQSDEIQATFSAVNCSLILFRTQDLFMKVTTVKIHTISEKIDKVLHPSVSRFQSQFKDCSFNQTVCTLLTRTGNLSTDAPLPSEKSLRGGGICTQANGLAHCKNYYSVIHYTIIMAVRPCK